MTSRVAEDLVVDVSEFDGEPRVLPFPVDQQTHAEDEASE